MLFTNPINSFRSLLFRNGVFIFIVLLQLIFPLANIFPGFYSPVAKGNSDQRILFGDCRFVEKPLASGIPVFKVRGKFHQFYRFFMLTRLPLVTNFNKIR